MISLWRWHGPAAMPRWGFCWLLLGLWRFSAACPSSCTCGSSRITCTEQDRGIIAFPVLSSAAEMENITDIYIANQNKLRNISDIDMDAYMNLRNLTVANSGLEYVSRFAFHKNTKLQYINLKNNKLSTLSWKTFRHLNLTYFVVAGNPFRCSCDIEWLKLWKESEVAGLETQDLICKDNSNKRIILYNMRIPKCVLPTALISPSSVVLLEGSDITLECNTSGSPSLEVNWYLDNFATVYQADTLVQPATLKLTNISYTDNGRRVFCTAENVVGESESSVLLVVHFPPKIIYLDKPMSDHHWCIPFSVRGNPKPELQWFYEGAVLNENDFIQTKIHVVNDTDHHGCLQMDNPTHINNGQYTLLAKNQYGMDKSTVFALFMRTPWDNDSVTEPIYYDYSPENVIINGTEEKTEEGITVYVVVGIAAVAFTGFVLMLIILKFGRNSKFGIKESFPGFCLECTAS